ncbi:MAG TPA: nucleotide-diphospho-sugar transferase, partial [Bacteroidales bacterium]|nr:nucleotide-diphospho-sugar transferase [Bacteroidales bacterium]
MENKKLTTPVLLITFNRADNTRKVFEKIKEAKIPKLYIANDAPRFGNKNDKENRAKIREMLNEIDWNCELHTLFHEENQGCGYG